MKRFESHGRLDASFLPSTKSPTFSLARDHDTAAELRSGRTQAFATWTDVTGIAMAA